jgi:adenylosuccinate lyase
MIERYTRKEIAKIWSPEEKFKIWLKIEILVCEAWNKLGFIPDDAVREIKERAGFDIERIDELEKTVKHDVIAFLTAVSERVGKSSRYIHFGMTSSDVLDTSFAVQLNSAADIIIKDINELLPVLKKLAFKYKELPMIGRTHGVHAEPITFGHKVAIWYEEMKRNLERMKIAKETISYGKISGAVGTFSTLLPEIENYVCEKLGLKPEPASNQIVQRDRHAHFFTTLAIIASSIEKIALEVRHLQRTEVLEAEEPFTKGQKGSSAMPHKRNPILSENLCGLARLVRGYAFSSLENVALWHERDISHSSVERVIGPDATILVDFMLTRLTSLLSGLVVYPENMEKNLQISKGLIFSEKILLELVKKGLTREDAYALVQKNAMKAREDNSDFKEMLKNDREVNKFLTPEEIEKCFDLKHHLSNIDKIFQRVFKE